MSSQPNTTVLDEHRDIPYIATDARNPLHEFDLYVPKRRENLDTRLPPLVCFIHGGAWRSEDKAEHAGLARRLAAHTNFPVAVPNYRLTTASTPIRHPGHAEDLLAFLHSLLTWSGPQASAPTPPYDPTRLYLIGHSCSAHMLTSIFLQPPEPASDASPLLASPSSTASGVPSPPPSPIPTPDTLVPSPALLAATHAIVMSEGLYDLDALLVTYPAYKTWFIAPTFGRLRSYAPWNTASYQLRPGAEHLRWLILHSKGDTLVDQGQSERIWGHLTELYGQDVHVGDKGGPVQREWEVLTEEHNEMLAGEVYPRLVGDYILANIQCQESAGPS
ncbi:Alpha/Beta hydrolase protein [Rhodofomes roseus]|uniref:Alpha/Beta hydrolase protein n=1 Tax=Rhodofomes roseus TaxID=34475 RepID=A0ABQ8KV35_9APHY|nr:Alpha/Beta hydrolase protein [Rhodofomes roseus]KAH9842671.1 Alpha/Beta hydrolase protein [Rhodofomes roseus]